MYSRWILLQLVSSLENIQELKKKRFLFLTTLYEMAGSDEVAFFDPSGIANVLGFDSTVLRLILQYLKGEDLIHENTFRVNDGNPYSGTLIGITHKGVKVVEWALENPNEESDYFPPAFSATYNIRVGKMENSQIQQGSPNGKQELTIGAGQIRELQQIINMLYSIPSQASLSPDIREKLESNIVTIKEQAKSKPKIMVLAEALTTTKSILQEIKESCKPASGIIQSIDSWLKGI